MAEGISLASGEVLSLPIPAPAAPDSAPGPADLPRREPRDPQAPFGFKSDGTPKRGPGGRPPKADRPRVADSPQAVPKAVTADRVAAWQESLYGYGTGISAACLMAASATGSVALEADGYAVSVAAPGLSKAVADLGAQDARIARALDKICSAGPYAALMTAAVGLGAQIAANHNVIKPGFLGTVSADIIVASFNPGTPGEDDSVPLAA